MHTYNGHASKLLLLLLLKRAAVERCWLLLLLLVLLLTLSTSTPALHTGQFLLKFCICTHLQA
jgi:hypothetical protein